MESLSQTSVVSAETTKLAQPAAAPDVTCGSHTHVLSLPVKDRVISCLKPSQSVKKKPSGGKIFHEKYLQSLVNGEEINFSLAALKKKNKKNKK